MEKELKDDRMKYMKIRQIRDKIKRVGEKVRGIESKKYIMRIEERVLYNILMESESEIKKMYENIIRSIRPEDRIIKMEEGEMEIKIGDKEVEESRERLKNIIKRIKIGKTTLIRSREAIRRREMNRSYYIKKLRRYKRMIGEMRVEIEEIRRKNGREVIVDAIIRTVEKEMEEIEEMIKEDEIGDIEKEEKLYRIEERIKRMERRIEEEEGVNNNKFRMIYKRVVIMIEREMEEIRDKEIMGKENVIERYERMKRRMEERKKEIMKREVEEEWRKCIERINKENKFI